jgi:hypothetical protein
MAIANITITIPPFTDSFLPPKSNAGTIKLAECQPSNMVLVSGPANVTVIAPVPATENSPFQDAKINITGTDPVQLRFTVVDDSGGKYAECGLVFTTGDIYATGTDGFPDFVVDDQGLLVTDADAFRGKFSFQLLVQNSNRGMGLVDPQISNGNLPGVTP